MSRVATVVPAESDLLCEGCGYTLNGLPTTSNCPECGKPIQQSIGDHRRLTEWDVNRRFKDLWVTSGHAIFRPTDFYRTLATRVGYTANDQSFAMIHWMFASLLFAGTGIVHLLNMTPSRALNDLVALVAVPILALPVIVMLVLLTWVAAKLTRWEAAYRGYRLPLNVVLRGMYYHAAHYQVAALLGFTLVFTYRILLIQDIVTHSWDMTYLYVLCAAVVLSAIYLFHTYWVGMKNIMYANR